MSTREPEPPALILILEDDAGIAHLERLRLTRAGYSVALASTWTDARRLVELGGVDLLLLDFRLRGQGDGVSFYRDLRASGRDIPAILVTAFGDEAMTAEARTVGIREVLPKSADYIDDLVPTVRRVLGDVAAGRGRGAG